MLARYCQLLSIKHSALVLEQAIGSRGTFVTTLLPRLADFVANTFGGQVDSEDFAREHTAYNYLTAFMGVDDRAKFMKSLLTVAGPTGKRHGQIGTTLESHLLFCPRCLEEDVAAHGQGYWRTTHQLPGVYFCPSHGEPLLMGAAPSRTCMLVACDGKRLPGTDLHVLFVDSFARSVATESAWLVRNGMPPANPADAARAMRSMILAAGWGDGKGRVSSRFIQHLLAVSAPGQQADGSGRLRAHSNLAHIWVTPGMRPRSPLGQIMAVVALGRTLKELATEIQEVQKKDGSLKKQLSSARMPVAAKSTRRHRKTFLKARKVHPEASRSELSAKLANYCTRYLAAHDGEWLEAHMPAKYFFDWATVDADTAAKVPEARRALFNRPGPPKRVTETELARAVTTLSRYATSANKLPLTRAAVKANAETIESKNLRRIAWTAYQAVIEGRTLKSA